MVQRKRPTRGGKKAVPDFLTKAARMVGTALGSISVKVRGKQNDRGPELSEPAAPKRPRKAAAAKKAVRKAGTKSISSKRKRTDPRAKKNIPPQ